jgi:phenylalanyl-tRNA synthetase beta chain
MEVSYQWLQDFLPLTVSPVELAEKLTMAGVPAEEIREMSAGIALVKVGRLVKMEKHPDADRLLVCSVDVGEDDKLSIVTGATNLYEGALVPVALHGAVLPGGVKIKRGKLRGVESEGMLCSAKELNLNLDLLSATQREGIYLLPEELKPGTDIVKALGLDDTVLSLELTPNRGDCFSHLGVARDAAALLGGEVQQLEFALEEIGDPASKSIQVKIESPYCHRYIARVIRGVKIAPSPLWLANRLRNLGLRSINNVADVTNLVMMGLGQPLHAFDLAKIQDGKIIVRQARDQETLVTLDGSERQLDPTMVVIADTTQPVALAGVMGGLASEVSEATTDILLECALFDGITVRKTAQKLALRSEASNRYEKGIDAAQMEFAVDYAASLMAQVANGRVGPGRVDAGTKLTHLRLIDFDSERINRILGTQLSPSRMIDILVSLGFEYLMDQHVFTVPSWRGDVAILEDLAEEIARIDGYDNIPVKLLSGQITSSTWPRHVVVDQQVRNVLLAGGFSEAINFSFISGEVLNKLNLVADSPLRNCVELKNPVSDDFRLMRTTLAAGLLESVARNISRQVRTVELFETARIYSKLKGEAGWPFQEKLFLGAAITTDSPTETVSAGDELYFRGKGILENIARQLRLPMEFSRYQCDFLHPGRCACVTIAGEVVGLIGEVHPQVAAAFEIRQRVGYFELDLHALARLETLPRTHADLPRFPLVERDLAFLADNAVEVQSVVELVKQSGAANLESIRFFDVYRGKQLPHGKQSIAFKLIFRAPDRTLTVEDTENAIDSIVGLLRDKMGLELRS